MIDLTPIFQAIISLIATVIMIKVIPWIKAKTTAQQQAILRAAVSVTVYAAEQMYIAGKITNKLNYVKQTLELQGYTVDINEIEAAVRELTIAQEQPESAVITVAPPALVIPAATKENPIKSYSTPAAEITNEPFPDPQPKSPK